MLRPASALTVRVGFGLALISSSGIVWIVVGMNAGLQGWMIIGGSVLLAATVSSGLLGAVFAARIVAGAGRLTALLGVVIAVVCALGLFANLLVIFIFGEWDFVVTTQYCEGGCGPTDYEVRAALTIATIVFAVLAVAVISAALTKNATPRERIRIALLVIVASMPVANLLVFTAVRVHNNSPSAAGAPVG